MIPRDKIVGRRITNVYKSPSEIGPAAILEGISTENSEMELFAVFLELDNDNLLQVGLDDRYAPMELLDSSEKEGKELVQHDDEVDRECIGETIRTVYREGMGFIVELESGSALWLEEGIFGTGLVLSCDYLKIPRLSEIPLTDYWTNERVEFGTEDGGEQAE